MSAGILQGANNTQAQNSTFNDFSGQFVINQQQYGTSTSANVWPSLHHLLKPVNASHNNRSGKRACCLFGTRQRVLHSIEQWASYGKRPICWLSGPAGSGKSTIAQTIAEWCTEEGRLGGSFFFLRGTGDRDKVVHLVPTLAFQLAMTFKGTKQFIEDALEKEPSIVETGVPLSYQFRKLIMDPVLSDNPSRIQNFFRRRPVIVVDALDECDPGVDEFVEAVVDAFVARKGNIPFHLLVTSRVEEHLRTKFENPVSKRVILHLKLENYDASNDIRLFLRSEFNQIYGANQRLMEMCDVPQPWPSHAALETLVKEAAGSYIYASTFIDFVSKAGGMPHQMLIDAMQSHGLDPLYMQVFSRASASYPEGLHTSTVDLQRVMGALLLLNHPLAIKDLASLLNISTRDLVKSLLSIQTILLIPESNDHPVHLVHTSLRDFLVSQSRSGPYFIDPPTRHICIAIDCIDIMTKRSKDICFLDDSVLYASRNWLSHIYEGFAKGMRYFSDPSLFVSLKESLINLESSSLDSWLDTLIMDNSQRRMNEWNPSVPLHWPQDLQHIIFDLVARAKSLMQDFHDYSEQSSVYPPFIRDQNLLRLQIVKWRMSRLSSNTEGSVESISGLISSESSSRMYAEVHVVIESWSMPMEDLSEKEGESDDVFLANWEARMSEITRALG